VTRDGQESLFGATGDGAAGDDKATSDGAKRRAARAPASRRKGRGGKKRGGAIGDALAPVPGRSSLAGYSSVAPSLDAVPGASPAGALDILTLTSIARDILEGAFTPLWVRGEVSDFKAHRNGHWYFCLRDEQAQIRCVVWSREARRLPAPPDDGMQIVALGQLTVYPARGDMQLTVLALEAQGDGLWRKAMERTRQRLAAEGLLDPARKRRLPAFPSRIAVITSQDGAALHDIVSVVKRRCPATEIVLVPAAVQGEWAPDSLCTALDRVARWGEADVLIIGRGGGAREDLWAFNDEQVARAVAACPIPTISAVGHEIDITICDLVADARAATPSAAAEAAVPLLSDVAADVRALGESLRRAATRQVDHARRRLAERRRDLVETSLALVDARRRRVELLASRLGALSPLATLARGYAVARDTDGTTLASAGSFAPGQAFDLLMRDGTVQAVVEGVELGTPARTSTASSPEAA
jgi:exodeoxyribonuclease VII large subunit